MHPCVVRPATACAAASVTGSYADLRWLGGKAVSMTLMCRDFCCGLPGACVWSALCLQCVICRLLSWRCTVKPPSGHSRV